MPIDSIFTKFSEPKVLLIGAPLLDLIFLVSENFVSALPGKKGGMELIDQEQYHYLLLKAGIPEKQAAGGSAANVAKTLAKLGTSTSFCGMLGNDKGGKFFEESFKKLKISSLCKIAHKPTGHVFCFVTPDALRTCRSFLGASEEYLPSDLQSSYFHNKCIVHVEGYSLLKPGLIEKALQLAKEHKALFSFDLGSFEIVERNKNLLENLLPHIDLLFGNEQEANSLTNHGAEESCRLLKEKVKVAIVFQGEHGCWAGQTGKEVIHIPAYKVKATDTTGAGDVFAGAFIHWLLKGKSLQECAAFGAFSAAEAVTNYGTDLPDTSWERILAFRN